MKTFEDKEVARNQKRDTKLFKSKVEFVPSSKRTFLIFLARHKLSEKNHLEKIPTNYGAPIGGYVRDNNLDCYYVNCRDFISVGYIYISYSISVQGSCHWQESIPMPEPVILNYLSDQQKRDIEEFRSMYNADDVTFHFLQLLAE